MAKECLWYNEEMGCYDLLGFEPKGRTNKEIRETAFGFLKNKYGFTNGGKERVLETLYLIDVDDLKRVN